MTAIERESRWFAEDCACRVLNPDGDRCALWADFTDGLCSHCHGHALIAAASDNQAGTRKQVPGGNPIAVQLGNSAVALGEQVPGGNRVPASDLTDAALGRLIGEACDAEGHITLDATEDMAARVGRSFREATA